MLPSLELCLGHEPDPGREVPSSSPTLATRSGGQHLADARDRGEPFAGLTGAVPNPDHAIEFKNLCLQHLQLGTESCNTATCDLRQALITSICDDSEQLIDTPTSDRCDDAE